MSYQLHVQNPENYQDIPSRFELNRWATLCLGRFKKQAEVTIRFISSDEMQSLNKQFRHKDKPTNVLSFPSELPDELNEGGFLGDILICCDVIKAEANEQGKKVSEHYAHLLIHGLLHLLGYDHIIEKDAAIMESLEIDLLKQLNIKNPYENEE